MQASNARPKRQSPPASAGQRFDEDRWLDQVMQQLTEQEAAGAVGAAAKVCFVPRVLWVTRPEAYLPQHFALGPFHCRRAELRDMERYKVAGAKRTEKSFAEAGHKIKDLADKILKEPRKIRGFYQRDMELQDKTLAWMMAMDTCFLLDFLEGHHCERNEDASSATKWINATICDAMMLQNQIPLFLFSWALALRSPDAGQQVAALSSQALVLRSPDAGQVAAVSSALSSPDVATTLSDVLIRFIQDVSPIEIDIENTPNVNLVLDHFPKHAHILELLYHFLVPEARLFDDENWPPVIIERGTQHANASHSQVDNDDKKEATCMSRVVESLKNIMIAYAPQPVAKLLTLGFNSDKKGDLEQPKGTKSEWTEEITIPSVAELARLGVQFVPTKKGIAGIDFDPATATLTLPKIRLNGYTEVVLRNLVAYEAVAVRGPLVLARYTELMNGIIDTPKDVKILRWNHVVVNSLKSDQEAADMWNGMCRATRPSKVSGLDETIEKVNDYSKTAAPPVTRRLKKYVFRSWRILSLLAAIVLLLMTAMQTFCSAYPCTQWFGVL